MSKPLKGSFFANGSGYGWEPLVKSHFDHDLQQTMLPDSKAPSFLNAVNF